MRTVARFLQEHGTLSLEEVLQPAIKFARGGFPMYHKLYEEIVNHADRLALFPASASLYLNENDPTRPKCEVG